MALSRLLHLVVTLLIGAAGALPVLAQSAVIPPAAGTVDGGVLAQRFPKLSYRGGPFLRRPRIVTVTFVGDDAALVSRLEQFGDTITRTSWWRAVVDGYCATRDDCIGDGRAGAAVRLSEELPPVVHAVDVSALLRRAIAAGTLGALDPESLLLVYLPTGVTLKDAFAPAYCGEGPRAFHRTLRLDGRVIGYAVLPRCGDEAALTGTASHELLETVMNPDTSRPGFAFGSDAAARGFAAAGNEAMDPCGFITNRRDVMANTFVVRRAWSARQAALGHDPCVPHFADRPYVALVPQQPAVRLLNPGETASLQLEAAADRPIERWSVVATDLTGSQLGEAYVEVSLEKGEASPGSTQTLRIKLLKAPPNGLSVVGIVSTFGADAHLWPLAVISR